MASEETEYPVKRKRLDGIRKLTHVLSGLRFRFDVSRLTEVL
jgi:hypothetical protein